MLHVTYPEWLFPLFCLHKHRVQADPNPRRHISRIDVDSNGNIAYTGSTLNRQ